MLWAALVMREAAALLRALLPSRPLGRAGARLVLLDGIRELYAEVVHRTACHRPMPPEPASAGLAGSLQNQWQDDAEASALSRPALEVDRATMSGDYVAADR